jgi:hypothetical protein
VANKLTLLRRSWSSASPLFATTTELDGGEAALQMRLDQPEGKVANSKTLPQTPETTT